jgi:transcriptional regulator with XRE-family HTH domain
MPPKNRQFAKFIAKHRETCGMTQQQLADKLGVSKPSVHYWESGKSFPQAAILEPLARALSVDFEDLLALTNDEYADSLLGPNIYFRALYPNMSKKEAAQVEELVAGFEGRRRKGRKRGN